MTKLHFYANSILHEIKSGISIIFVSKNLWLTKPAFLFEFFF